MESQAAMMRARWAGERAESVSNTATIAARVAGFSPHISQEAGEAMTIIGLVSAGLGVSVLPASYQRIRIDGVVYRTLLDPQAVTAVWLVQRKGHSSPMATAFAQLLTRKMVHPSPGGRGLG